MKTLLLLLAAVGCLAFASAGRASETVRIHYIPFDAETFVAITADNIESSAVRSGEVHVMNPAFRELKALLDVAGRGLLDRYKLRAKLALPFQEVIYIDQSGGLRSNFKGEFKLSEANRRAVENLIRRLTEPRGSQ